MPAPKSCDVLILGGGPAGCAVALMLLALRPNLRLIIAENETDAVVRPGEALAAQALPLLRQLGIDGAFLAQQYLQSQGIRAYWGTSEAYERHQLMNYSGAGWQLDRHTFHTFLRQCVQDKGGEVLQGRFTGHAQRDTDLWQIGLVLPQTEDLLAVHCPLVLDATGRKAVFARHCGATIVHSDRLCGVQRFFDLPENTHSDHLIQIEAMPDGWWYSAPLPHRRCAVTWFSDSDLIRASALHLTENWDKALALATNTHERLYNTIPSGDIHVFNAMSQHLTTAAGAGWLAVGDAACAFDPLSGQGMYKALRSGIWAAFAAFDLLKGDPTAVEKYKYIVSKEVSGYKEAHTEHYKKEQRWATNPFWQRRA